MKRKKIIYISGEGLSGSTLLDLVLGSHEKAFSAGELRFLAEKGIKNREYCACGSPVPECILWKEIISLWEKNRSLDLETYIQLQNMLLSMKNFFTAQKLLKNRPEQINNFLEDTGKLYDLIFQVTNCNYIIDSSKAPGMIPVLKEIDFDITVIHLTRKFGHVLNSNKKPPQEKDLKAGIEHDMEPRKTSYILQSWFLKNSLTKRYSKGMDYKRIKYEDYIDDLQGAISKIADFDPEYKSLLDNRGPFYPRHLVAGNAMRMRNEIFVAQKPRNTSYERLNLSDRFLAKVVDAFY